MENRNYKIFFSDLDETLLVNYHVPNFNREAIKKCREKGTKFVVASGRQTELIEDILQEIGTYNLENEYSICYTGLVIVENKNSKILNINSLPRDIIQKLIYFGNNYDIDIMVYTLKKLYYFKTHKDSIEILKKIDEDATYKILNSLDINQINEEEKLIKITFSKNDEEFLKDLKKEMKEKLDYYDQLDIFFSSGRYMEINPKGINKGYAIKWLCDYLKIDIKDAIAIGDNYNDIPMIKAAGLGCCVASAEDDVKKISDYVCEKDYAHGAVAEVIEKFILNPSQGK